nr:MAG TPA: hypothetical protein [Caudoviricetes sp.]
MFRLETSASSGLPALHNRLRTAPASGREP